MQKITKINEHAIHPASASVWDWKENQLTTSGPNASAMRLKGGLQGFATGFVSLLLFHYDLIGMGYIAAGLAVLVLSTAMLSPTNIFAALDRGSIKLGYWLGSTMKWIILPIVFYAFFLPFGKIFRRGKRDVLKRYYEVDADTYWCNVEANKQEPDRRRRQF